MLRLIIFLLLQIIPSVYCSIEFNEFGYWPLSGLAIFVLLVNMVVSSRLNACLLSGVIGLANVLLLSSLYFQGVGFNDQFFFHLDFETLKIAWKHFPELLMGASYYILLCIFWPLMVYQPRISTLSSRWLIILSLISLLCFAPLISTVNYLSKKGDFSFSDLLLQSMGGSVSEIKIESLYGKPKNIILIYAESLEQLYFDESVFGSVLPGLTALKKQGIDFQNIQQTPGTEFTIAGILASHCGVPLNIRYNSGYASNSTLAAMENPLSHEVCLSDILKAHNYETVFMGGSDHKFAGKGQFLKTHGYNEIYGKYELIPRLEDPDYYVGWGIYDDSLLQFAEEKIEELSQGEGPYLLTLLTLDTHHPDGHPSRTCKDLPNQTEQIKNAVTCSDFLLSKFIEKLRARDDYKDTLIVLMSDHLAMRNGVSNKLKEQQSQRRLTFVVWGDWLYPEVMSNAGTHYDVTPTLLDMLGFQYYDQHNLGSTLYSGKDGYWFRENEKARIAAENSDLFSNDMILEGDIEFFLGGPTIRLGDDIFHSNYDGFDLGGHIFAMLFDRQSRSFNGFISVPTVEEFEEITEDNFAIAISDIKEFGQRYSDNSNPALYSFYAGFPGQKLAISGNLLDNHKISGQAVEALFASLK